GGGFSPDGRYFASAFAGGGVRVWDLSRHEPLTRIDFPKTLIPGHGVIFSPDSQVIAIATTERTVRRYNLVSGAELPRLEIEVAPDFMVFSPSGRKLALLEGNNLRIWSVEERKELARLTHNAQV